MFKTNILILVCLCTLMICVNTSWAATAKKPKRAASPIVITKSMPKKIKSLSKKKIPPKAQAQTKTKTKIQTLVQTKTPINSKTQTKLNPKKVNLQAKPKNAPKKSSPIQTTAAPLNPTPVSLSPHTPQNIYTVISQFEQKLLKTLHDKNIPGCAVAIVYKNQVVFLNGYGVRTIGKPEKIDADTVFQLGSVSKPIAATLTTLLENRGLLNIQDPVSRYLPNFSLNGAKDPTTLKIKHVLNHSSGLPRSGFNHLIETFAPHTRLIRALQTTRISAPIGKRYDYHNAMFSLINEITFAATRQSFPDSLSTYLLKPLNMHNTTATYNGLLQTPNRATPHVKNQKGKMIPEKNYSTGYYSVAPAGGINSSIRDMSNFLKAQLGGYPTILDQATLARLQQPLIATPSTSLSAVNGARDKIKNSQYGLGWRIIDFNQKKLIYHGGWVKGFKNFIALMPDHQVGIVILHNSENKGFSNRLAMQFLDIFFSSP